MCIASPSTPLFIRQTLLFVYRKNSSLLSSKTSSYLCQHKAKFFSTTLLNKMAPPPAVVSEPVTVHGRQYRAVREGLALILAPYRDTTKSVVDPKTSKKPHNNDEGDQAVFYNPIQQYNRDLSVLAILTYGESVMIEKEAKVSKNQRVKKDRKSKKKSKGEASNHSEGTIKPQISKKRKADEAEGVDSEEMTNGKKAKVEEQPEIEDDGMEVQQLEVDDEVEIVTEQANGKNRSDQAKVGAALPPSTTESTTKQHQFTILDALSASGLRAIRYAKEIPFATNVVANDLSAEAVKSIELNIDHNELRGKVHSNVGDARAYMYSKVGNEHQNPPAGYVHKFDVVDLDPYGTAAPFLDSAIQALGDGGLLCVTCTDAGVFASNGYPEKAYSLYGGVTMKGPFSHEAGLRLILHAVATSAAKYSIAIEPLLSLSIDFYARLFIRVHKQPQQVKVLAGTTMITYNCDVGCGAWKTQPVARNQEREDKIGQTYFKHSYAQGPSATPLCEHCSSKTHLGGPMWAGPLHNPYFIQRILDTLPDVDTSIYHTTDRIKGMLTLALEEDLTLATSNASPSPSNSKSNSTTTSAAAAVDPKIIPRMPPQTLDTTPFFFIPNYLAKILHCATPPEDQLRGAIRHLGYKVTRSHCKAGSFKTNAPWDVLWEIMREWIRQHAPVKPGKVTPTMPGWKIMQKVRGRPEKNAADVAESLKRTLERGFDTEEDLRNALESALYRLEHPRVEPVDDAATATGTAADEKPTDTSPATEENDTGKDGGEKDSTTTVKRAWNEARDVSKLKIVFDADLGREKPRGRLVRYQINPRANWGPMNRAGGAGGG